jgi:hypothetical protein
VKAPRQKQAVVVGWVEVWTNTVDELTCESVPLELPRLTARFEDGRYRLRERKSLVLPDRRGAVS